MYLRLLVCIASAIAFNSCSTLTLATITNGSFETETLEGWTALGDVSVAGSFRFPESSHLDGNQAALLVSESVDIELPDQHMIEAVLRQPTGTLSDLSENQIVLGSVVAQDVAIDRPMELSFAMSFYTSSEILPDTDYNDFAFLSISPGQVTLLADTNNDFLQSDQALFRFRTRGTTARVLLTSIGTFRIGFGVVSVGDDAFASALLLDDVKLADIGHLKGDFDNSGSLELNDIVALSSAIRTGPTDIRFDLNSDRIVNGSDLAVWVRDLRRTWFGDANLNGRFDSGDLVQVFQGGEYEDEIVGNSTWSSGDWNADGEFSTSDLVVAFQDGGYEQGPRLAISLIPEPNPKYLILSAMWGIGLLRGCTLRRWCCGFDCCMSSAKD
jgi:hypothetical protein